MNRVLLLCFSPLLVFSFINNGTKKNRKLLKWTLVSGFTFYGAAIVIPEGGDGAVHLHNVYSHYTDLGFTQFLKELINILILKGNLNTNDDPYIHLVSYFCGSVLRVPQLFFVCVSFVYGYFFSGVLIKVLKGVERLRGWSLGLLVVVGFVLYKGVDGIQTVRTYTGLWILVYALLSYYEKKQIKYLFLLFLPPFIHVGYWLMSVPTWMVVVAGERYKVYALIFFVSFGFKMVSLQPLMNIIGSVETGESKLNTYYIPNDANYDMRMEERANSGNWYRKGVRVYQVQKIGVQILASGLILLGFYSKRFMTDTEISLMSAGLLTFALSNLTTQIYAVANRSGVIAAILILSSFVSFAIGNTHIIRHRKWFRHILFLVVISFIPLYFYQFSAILEMTGIFALWLPMFAIVFPELNISLRQAIHELTGL